MYQRTFEIPTLRKEQGLCRPGGEGHKNDRQAPTQGLRLIPSAQSSFAADLGVVNRTQLYDVWLWRKFADMFKHPGIDDFRLIDKPNGWRGEYWGKMMRGASIVCLVTRDETLYSILTDSVRDLLSTAEEDGRISTYSRGYELIGWDMWCRKYVLLGLQYYLEICRDEALRADVIRAMCRHADYIMDRVGKEEGKTPITLTSKIWKGLNSSSILEPFVRLYSLTQDSRYLDFAAYIIEEGGTAEENIFEEAFKDEKAPYEYDVVKAYEMMSCFEGLIEYARITDNEHYKQAAIRFGYKVLATDVTVIGCCGCTHELFDHSAKMQTRPADDLIMQETCVTVTWMKLCRQLLCLTGDPVFADAMEQSYCNAYLGALNTRCVTNVLYNETNTPDYREHLIPSFVLMPFDSYSPLTADSRGRKIGGKCPIYEDNTYYGCCACIGSAGIGVMGEMAVALNEKGVLLNYYVDGRITLSADPENALLTVRTGYPYETSVEIRVGKWDPELGKLTLRIPAWSKKTSLTVNGTPCSAENGYVTLEIKSDDLLLLELDDRVRRILPPCPDGPDADRYEAFAIGPVLLAKDLRLADNLSDSTDALLDAEEYGSYERIREPLAGVEDARLAIRLKQASGGSVELIDYSTAGNTLTPASACAVWIDK